MKQCIKVLNRSVRTHLHLYYIYSDLFGAHGIGGKFFWGNNRRHETDRKSLCQHRELQKLRGGAGRGKMKAHPKNLLERAKQDRQK